MSESRAAYFREYRSKRAAIRNAGGFLPFQAAFASAVSRKEQPVDIAALSVPRGNGKSWLCGKLVARSLTPGDPLHEPAVENILVAASRAQASIVLDFARAALGEGPEYRWREDGAIHIESRTRVRVISSDSRRALGLGANVRLAICDEPGAWSPTAGRRLWDAITTALGKRAHDDHCGRDLGTGAIDRTASWWPSFVSAGSGDGRHVSLLQADSDRWEDFQEVLRVNPWPRSIRTCVGRLSVSTRLLLEVTGRRGPSSNTG